ncbi:pyrrolidone-carboxylate peptidase [Caldalkalibacillus thermarum]|uniref:pyroglutamyl-peptidase I n=1 Tax=Caldalkalibacillus thermarum TaxID=296745 RepID=UPI0016676880|nr:pyroglutamyl-peptidase I [Caldalkalibacillus thermarum]GGK28360.1 pyrrolidone-carboxylate peptidase [Caldalkalibacillus thermarum]
MNILITGFEPFGGMRVNPTQQLIEAIEHEDLPPHVRIHTALLPVHYDECVQRVIAQIEQVGPDVVISCGLAAGRTAITPERIGINIKDTAPGEAIPDNRGVKPVDEPINPDGPDGLFSTLPNRRIVNKLREHGIPAYISNTAGTYICNNTLYGTLDYIRRKQLPIRAGFIHFPASTEMSVDKSLMASLPLDTMLTALRLIVETVAEDVNA